MNKRKLNREINTNVGNTSRLDSGKKFPDLRIRKSDLGENEAKHVEDPLLKFSQTKSVKEDKVKQSFNILQKLGGGGSSMTPLTKDKNFEKFKIPDFKPKNHSNKLGGYAFHRDKNDDGSSSSVSDGSGVIDIASLRMNTKSRSVPIQIKKAPTISEEESSKPKEDNPESSNEDFSSSIRTIEKSSDSKRTEIFDKKLPVNFRRNSVASEQEPIRLKKASSTKPKKSALQMRQIYRQKGKNF